MQVAYALTQLVQNLTERSGGNGGAAVFMACYDCFFVQSMPLGIQAASALRRSMFDVMEQQRCYAAGQSPQNSLCRTHPYGVLMLKVSSLLVYMTASVMAVASPLAHSGSRVVSIRQSTKRSERSDFTRLPMVFGRICNAVV